MMRRLTRWAACMGALAAAAMAPAQGPTGAPLAPTVPQPRAAPPPVALNGSARQLTGEDVGAWLDGYMPYALRNADIAGAVVTVVKEGQVILARGYGYADIAKHTPVDPARTLFRPGSVSKLVTWTAVMQLVEAGKIDLDADVNRYLDFKIPPRNGRPITMRQILTHTAGFEERDKELITYDTKKLIPIETYLKLWTPHRIYDAGTTPAYSNWATTLAGYVVQRVSGMSFDDYVDSRIFAPLNMTTATFRQPLPARLVPLMSAGYPRASEPAKGFELVVAAPAGSLSASGLDMAKFMIAHLENGRGILAPQTAATMHNSPLGRVDPRSLIPPLNRMELGFFETNLNGREVIGHLGDTNQMHTSLHLFTNEHVGFYVSFNSPGREGAVGVLRGQLFQDFADRYFPSTARPDGRVDAATAAAHARAMAGHWQNSRGSQSNFVNVLNLIGQMVVTANDKGELVIPAMKGSDGAVRKWVEIAPWVWREQGGHDRLAAQVVNGEPVRWSFDLISPFMVFDRVPAWRSAAWLMPALYASLGILLLTVLFWPASWYVRRRYAAPAPIAGRALRAARAVRVMALADLLVLGGWLLVMSALFGDAGVGDGLLRLVQIAGVIAFVGAVGIAAWNARETFVAGRPWTRKLWSVLVLLATSVVLWTAWAYSLLVVTVNY